MEDIIAKFFEQGIISGAFILVLNHILNKQDAQLKMFSDEMSKTNTLLGDISKILAVFDSRLERLEDTDKKE